jgi:hypothetical protein
VRVITLFLTTLILNVLAETSWGQPFETYDLRVNGTVIMAIPAHLRSPQRRDLVVISRTRYLPRGSAMGLSVPAAGRGTLQPTS